MTRGKRKKEKKLMMMMMMMMIMIGGVRVGGAKVEKETKE